MFFCNFPAIGNEKKKEKKNVGAEIGNGLLPKLCSDQGARQLGAGRWAQARTVRALGARPGRAAGPVGCALGALSLFLTQFDSVLFLSQFLDIVREPGS